MNETKDVKLTNADLMLLEQATAEKHNRLVRKYTNKLKTQKERGILATWQTLLQYISRIRCEADQGQVETARKAELDVEELARIQHNLMVEMQAELHKTGECPLCKRGNYC